MAHRAAETPPAAERPAGPSHAHAAADVPQSHLDRIRSELVQLHNLRSELAQLSSLPAQFAQLSQAHAELQSSHAALAEELRSLKQSYATLCEYSNMLGEGFNEHTEAIRNISENMNRTEKESTKESPKESTQESQLSINSFQAPTSSSASHALDGASPQINLSDLPAETQAQSQLVQAAAPLRDAKHISAHAPPQLPEQQTSSPPTKPTTISTSSTLDPLLTTPGEPYTYNGNDDDDMLFAGSPIDMDALERFIFEETENSNPTSPKEPQISLHPNADENVSSNNRSDKKLSLPLSFSTESPLPTSSALGKYLRQDPSQIQTSNQTNASKSDKSNASTPSSNPSSVGRRNHLNLPVVLYNHIESLKLTVRLDRSISSLMADEVAKIQNSLLDNITKDLAIELQLYDPLPSEIKCVIQDIQKWTNPDIYTPEFNNQAHRVQHRIEISNMHVLGKFDYVKRKLPKCLEKWLVEVPTWTVTQLIRAYATVLARCSEFDIPPELPDLQLPTTPTRSSPESKATPLPASTRLISLPQPSTTWTIPSKIKKEIRALNLPFVTNAPIAVAMPKIIRSNFMSQMEAVRNDVIRLVASDKIPVLPDPAFGIYVDIRNDIKSFSENQKQVASKSVSKFATTRSLQFLRVLMNAPEVETWTACKLIHIYMIARWLIYNDYMDLTRSVKRPHANATQNNARIIRELSSNAMNSQSHRQPNTSHHVMGTARHDKPSTMHPSRMGQRKPASVLQSESKKRARRYESPFFVPRKLRNNDNEDESDLRPSSQASSSQSRQNRIQDNGSETRSGSSSESEFGTNHIPNRISVPKSTQFSKPSRSDERLMRSNNRGRPLTRGVKRHLRSDTSDLDTTSDNDSNTTYESESDEKSVDENDTRGRLLSLVRRRRRARKRQRQRQVSPSSHMSLSSSYESSILLTDADSDSTDSDVKSKKSVRKHRRRRSVSKSRERDVSESGSEPQMVVLIPKEEWSD